MSAQARTPSLVDPRRYHESVDTAPGPVATSDPVCLYLETTEPTNLRRGLHEAKVPSPDMSLLVFARMRVRRSPAINLVGQHSVTTSPRLEPNVRLPDEGRAPAFVARSAPPSSRSVSPTAVRRLGCF